MRILALTNLHPRRGRELSATFNAAQFAALGSEHTLRLIVPVPWIEKLLEPAHRGWLGEKVNGAVIGSLEHPTYYYIPKVLRRSQGAFFLRSVRRTVARAIDEFRPDVMLGCWAYPDGWAAVQLAREAGLPVVIKVHGSDVLVVGRDPTRRQLVAEALTAADRVVVVSDDLARNVIALGVPSERICLVRNGVDTELFSPGEQRTARQRLGLPPDDKIVLFVGNVLLSKGVGVLVEAMGKLRKEGREKGTGTHGHCYIVGAGRDARKVRRMIARCGLEDVVTLVGTCPHARLVDWYRACDVVALPSFSEGVPNVLQEAISCGRPFVATRVGGIPEIAHPSFSRLVEPGDSDELANALAEMLAGEKRDGNLLCEAPFGPFRQKVPIPFFASPFQAITWQRSAELLTEVLGDAVARRVGTGHQENKTPTETCVT